MIPHSRAKHPRGGVSLRTAILCFVALIVVLSVWTWKNTRTTTDDGRQVIVFWGSPKLTDQLAPVLRKFEAENPQYKVIYSVPVTKDLQGDAQRLLCAVAGGVPPDVVYFDRFAIGEWAAKGAFEDLTPWLDKQDKNDPYYINLDDYYKFAVEEASYARPGSGDEPHIFGLPQGVDFRMLYMNVDLLKQEGFEDEAGNVIPPKNWEELKRYAVELSEFKDPNDKSKGMTRLGFGPNEGNSWLYLYAWQSGGEFLNKERTEITMTSPEVSKALKYMTDVYDSVGGFNNVQAFTSSFQDEGAQDPFFVDQIAMKIDGQWAMDFIADYKKDMNFAVVAPPMPQSELDKGRQPLTWSGGFAYIMPSTSQNKEGAFKLMQFLLSDETLNFMEEEYKQGKESQGKLYLPRGSAKRKLFEEVIQREVFDNPDIPKAFKDAYREMKKIGPNTYIRPVTPVGQMLWNKHIQGYELAVAHSKTIQEQTDKELAEEISRRENAGETLTATDKKELRGLIEARVAMTKVEAEVQDQLDGILSPDKGRKVNWTPYAIGYFVLILIPFFAIYYRAKKAKAGNSLQYNSKEVGWAMLFAAPWFIGMAVFIAGPILFSIVISFTSWDVLNDAHYVGTANYERLASDEMFSTSLGNTLFMLLRVPISMAIGLMIAMMMNRAMRGIGTYRTIFYLPAIMPVVASAYLWIWLLNPQTGPINQGLEWLFDTALFEWIESVFMTDENGVVGDLTAPQWFQDKLWSKPAMIIMNVWTAGSGMIIWLAGLQAIPKDLYEAARIDGANSWQRFWKITIPMLTPYILFNLIMGTIGTLQIFNEAFIMTQGGPENSTTFYAYYLFQQSFQYFRMGYASAMAWVLFMIVLALTVLKLWSSKKWVHYQS